MKIPITKPLFDQEDLDLIQEPLRTGWVVQGPRVEEFEKAFAEFTGAKHAVACGSCTAALHIALASLKLGPGDEAVLPSYTFVATANAVEYMGAKPVFCDIDLDTLNCTADTMMAKTTDATKVLIPVHMFGLSAELEPLLKRVHQSGAAVVEDAACALGARLNGRHLGTFGEVGCFSFHPRKAITTGEGGMVVTDSEDLAVLARSLRDHGAGVSDLERHVGEAPALLPAFERLGYNYRMTDIQGALGVSQMRKAPAVLRGRGERARRYDELLSDLDWLKLPTAPEGCEHSYQTYVCLLRPRALNLKNLPALKTLRDSMMERLGKEGVSTRQGTHAVHALGYYRKKYGIDPASLPSSLIAEGASLALPLYPQMTDEEQDFVVAKLKDAFESA